METWKTLLPLLTYIGVAIAGVTVLMIGVTWLARRLSRVDGRQDT